MEEFDIVKKYKHQFSLRNGQKLSLSTIATLRNNRKIPAISRETPETTRNSQSRNTLGPEKAQEHISQVSERIEQRVTIKLSEEVSWSQAFWVPRLSLMNSF